MHIRTVTPYTSAHVAINVGSECNKFASYSLNAKDGYCEQYMQTVHLYLPADCNKYVIRTKNVNKIGSGRSCNVPDQIRMCFIA
jgi:hypothetical protein